MIGQRSVDRIVLSQQLEVVSQTTVSFPEEWRPNVLDSEVFAVGQFVDTANVGAVTTANTGTSGCIFEYHEYRDGKWVMRARPSVPCRYGDFGTPRFAYESRETFDVARQVTSGGEVNFSYAVTTEVGQQAIGGTAEQVSSTTFRLGPKADEERDGWYYLAFDFEGRRAMVFYHLQIGDFVYVTDLYVQVAGAATAHRIERSVKDSYPAMVGRYLVAGVNVLDIVTGRKVLDEAPVLPFWHLVAAPR